MNQELIIKIVKWVLIVFIAAFIGYFGKYLSKIIINKFRKKEPKTIIIKKESPEKYKAKIEKKKLKLEKKKLKKIK